MTASLPYSLYRTDQVRDGERKIASDLGVKMYTLMLRAGIAAFHTLRKRWPDAKTMLICCGAGNNGGDGYVIARLALAEGIGVHVWSPVDPLTLQGDALAALKAYQAQGGRISTGSLPPLSFDLVVDALLGTGLNRQVSSAYLEVIAAINRSQIPVLSVDVPSGLDANTGTIWGKAINASVTITFVALKQGLFTGMARDHCGDIVFDGLEIDDTFASTFTPSAILLQPKNIQHLEPTRKKSAHKGQFGRLICIGGQKGMGGAITLCGQGALRTGAGLVTLLTAEVNMPAILARQPELMTQFWRERQGGEVLEHILAWADVIAVGPGLGLSNWSRHLFDGALAMNVPMVLDADALNLLAQYPCRYGNWVLTPHPGEAAKLLSKSVREIERDRFSAVKELHNVYGGVVVLKGAGTIVYDGVTLSIVNAGNPGMASGGMGDVLTGCIAALIAQTKDIRRSALYGTFLHSYTADIIAQQGERGLLASDLLPLLGKKINQMPA
ncbi:NAD(P)H-hydrate dehydratase [Enterovibrio nigricans]|uniref:Bifunctional NAD(P)H-hydrate repair enzyme n=1 Tax=Enterovibrio nigricans DSM 22720 TaxID=1121868 RepID=A0A1T4UTF4_9GAMM|nr:NAD(P)H-hydrate dehydratase [Enterovibrio nigricans]PKF50129.1 bifunctional ADP-dependent NAD(P)H-hydrate dehydratase/NAD(P)H-hydrate epimerase [Enterovibrio nigricans]SKA55898.1 NAD(P)H-hydrate epimerase [Enterovibrio nigricans DSM 22720]